MTFRLGTGKPRTFLQYRVRQELSTIVGDLRGAIFQTVEKELNPRIYHTIVNLFMQLTKSLFVNICLHRMEWEEASHVTAPLHILCKALT